MISLKHLLILMGSVSLLMMIAVAVVKIQNPSYVTLGEVRAIDRICHRYADDMMERIASKTTEQDSTVLRQLHECMGECRAYLIGSRAKSHQQNDVSPQHVPACFGEKLTRLAREAQQRARDTGEGVASPQNDKQAPQDNAGE